MTKNNTAKPTKTRTKKIQNPEPPNSDNEYPCLKVTASQVFPVKEPTGKTVALARCLLNDQLQLTHLRIVEGVNGLFVSYPNDSSYKNEYKCVYYPVTRALRDHIEEVLLAQYNELTNKVDPMIYCPKCGALHEVQPVQYKLEDEVESFSTEGYETMGEGENTIISIPSAHIEAGPCNSDRYLMDYDVKACSCPKCKATFYIE
ncbi:MAG: septation protein SpoVG family protein [Candidatus Neomarinimicrobiota bacterium]|jgi:stage V sporulation protein G